MQKKRAAQPVGSARPKKSQQPAAMPQFDRETIRELARCYARAAVDELITKNSN
jgi:hypothetical protein